MFHKLHLFKKNGGGGILVTFCTLGPIDSD